MNMLTTTEQDVLKAMAGAAIDSTGGDFGCTDEVKVQGLNSKQLGGYMTVLEKKGLVELCPTKVNDRRLVQYVFTEDGWTLAGHPEMVAQPALAESAPAVHDAPSQKEAHRMTKPNLAGGKGESPRIVIRVDKKLHAALVKAAEQERRSLSDFVRITLEDAVKKGGAR